MGEAYQDQRGSAFLRRFCIILYALLPIALFASEDLADMSSLTAKYRDDEARLKVAYSNCLSRLDHPSEGIVVPVETHPDGSVKVNIMADKAQFFDKESLVWCGRVTVCEYNLDGSIKMAFRANDCIVDRNTKSGWISGRGVGATGKTRISGCGIYFSFSDEFVKISSKVAITSSDFNFKGVTL